MSQINTMEIKNQPSESAEESFINHESPVAHPEDAHESAHSSEEGSEKHEGHHYLDALTQEIALLPEPEAKLQRVIDFMEQSLAQVGSPHFKSFWQARTLCLELFKENIAPNVRATLWTKYTELSKEARRLKDLLDEQSAFAVEQIEIAVKALENEIAESGDSSKSQPIEISKSLNKHFDFYNNTQHELESLNRHASRINALRKELIKTEMRVRKKNKFFQQLSQLGDKVFPRRKTLITDLSNQFITDVDAFISLHFSKSIDDSLFFLREEIKSLQGTAKLLTLNTHAFTQTRMRLSECWDKIKLVEKDRKKERAQQKTAFKENMDQVMQKITECNSALQAGLNPQDATKKIDEVVAFMRTIELGRDELRHLREQIAQMRQPIFEQLKSEEQKRHEADLEKQRQKRQQLQDLRNEIEQLFQSAEASDAAKLTADRDALLSKIMGSPILKAEKIEMERLLKPLRDVIADKKALSLTSLSNDDRQALEQLREALTERRQLRQEIKEQLESLRKTVGTSGLDFMRAMEINEQINNQKDRLDKINHGIQEIEDKIDELEG